MKKLKVIISAIGFLLLILAYLYFPSKLSKIYNSVETNAIVNLKIKPYQKPAELVELGDQSRVAYVTVVTTLFYFCKSKHSRNYYDKWLTNMIKSLGSPFIAYVDRHWSSKFIERSKEQNLTGIVYIFDSIWNIMRELETSRGRTYINLYLTDQIELDPEKHLHSPELYAVWNLKPYLLNKTAHLNPYKSNFFLYTDSGAWRTRQFPNWPDEGFVSQLTSKLEDRILFGEVGPASYFATNKRANIIQGTFFGGSLKEVKFISEQFFQVHDEWLDKEGMFVGQDQRLMNELAFARTKSAVVRLRTLNLKCQATYNPWFFYQYFFANSSDYICNEDKFSLLMLK